MTYSERDREDVRNFLRRQGNEPTEKEVDKIMKKEGRNREQMRSFLRQRYGREPTEHEVDIGLKIYELEYNKIRCFFRELSHALRI